MNWTFDYSRDANLVRVDVCGSFTLEDHARKMSELTSQAYWKPGINILFDCRRISFSRVEFYDIGLLAESFVSDDRLIGCGKVAFLMGTVTDFGVGRQFEILTDEKICADVRIFLLENLALAWVRD